MFIKLMNGYSCSSIIFGKLWPLRIYLTENRLIESRVVGVKIRLPWVQKCLGEKGVSEHLWWKGKWKERALATRDHMEEMGGCCWYCCNGGDRVYVLMEGSMRRDGGGCRRERRTGQLPQGMGFSVQEKRLGKNRRVNTSCTETERK